MPDTRPAGPAEFRRQVVDRVRAGRDPTDLAREFEPSVQAIRNWVRENVTTGEIPFRKAWLQAIVDRVEVGSGTVVIV